MLEDILLQVRKPSRYLGNEWNVSKKDFSKQELKFAICFPDLYEIGMSHLGLRIIYGLLNGLEGITCERVFLPDSDMLQILKTRKASIFSLESKRPLKDFDFIGFCLNYELDYTNLLAVLDLAGIPLIADRRPYGFPLIIAGGVCASNPEPLADFIDLFLIGEAEEALPELLSAYRLLKSSSGEAHITKEGILKRLAMIQGVYVPSFYDVEYNAAGAVVKFEPKYPGVPKKVKKRLVEDLDGAYYPTDWLIPYGQIVHDRAYVELMRGCPHRCNFCQAGTFYRHLRMRSPEKVIELAENIYRGSGYEEISLLGLSTSDYPQLAYIVEELSDRFKDDVVGISFPSLRPKSYLGSIAECLSAVRKTTLTFAPEAGSERTRRYINKNFDLGELYSVLLAVYRLGWQAVKLYFMIGLPQETYEDLDGILDIAKKVSELKNQVTDSPARVRLSISFFIPKPHTLLERAAMEGREALYKKKAYLIKKSKRLSRRIGISFHNLESSVVEAVLSRGSRRLGGVLLEAYNNGCLRDGWPEYFKPDVWRAAFEVCKEEMSCYLKERDENEDLPWQHIDLA